MKTPLYSIEVLEPTLGCSISRATALNDLGQVIGHSRHEDSDQEGACLWKDGTAHDMGRISVSDINNKGQIVGCRFKRPLSFRAILCENRQSQTLFQNNTVTSDAKGINDAGQVVGYALTPPAKWKTPGDIKRGAFLWECGKRRYLETPLGYHALEATAINNQGTVIGKVWQQDANDKRNNEHAVVWQGDSVDLLGEPKDFRSTQAEAINDLGQILVRATTWTSLTEDEYDFKQQSYLWHGGQWQAVEGMGLARSLNNQGQLVGWVGTDPKTAPGANERGGVHAALWEAGNIVDLNACVTEASDWILQRAVGINAVGQIIGNGLFNGQSRAFLLTPIT